MRQESAGTKSQHGMKRASRRVVRSRWVGLGSCLVSCFATTPVLAYRTGEDSPSLAGKGRVGWVGSEVPFHLSEGELPAGLGKAEVEQALSRSLATWSSPECSAIQPVFAGWSQEPAGSRDGKNTIAWIVDWVDRGFPEAAPGNTDMQYRGRDEQWRIAEADVFLNAADFDWSTRTDDATSVEVVLTHELGHALGLLHPCEPAGEDEAPVCSEPPRDAVVTTMYPFYDPEQSSLADDDIAGLCYLYPVGEECGECERGETCVDGECRATCGEQVCPAKYTCGAWGCAPEGACTDRDCVGQVCDLKTEDACGPLARCSDGVCVKGTTLWGDKCRGSADCATGACLEGICQPDCRSDEECGPLGSCLPTSDGAAQACVSSTAYQDGFTCASGEDCRSQICIFTEKQASCTSECESSVSCERGWSCKRVDDRDVCVPPDFKASGGCRMAGGGGAVGFGSVGWMMATAALLANRRRQRRNDT